MDTTDRELSITCLADLPTPTKEDVCQAEILYRKAFFSGMDFAHSWVRSNSLASLANLVRKARSLISSPEMGGRFREQLLRIGVKWKYGQSRYWTRRIEYG